MSRKMNLFTQVPVKNPKRNLFDLGHEVKMSMRFGGLYPVLLLETMPNDNIQDQMTAMVRMAPMIAPIMHRVNVKTDFFFVPMRLLTDQWEDFITGGQDGLSTAALPYYTPAGIEANAGATAMQKRSLWDYFGLPVQEGAAPGAWNTQHISALPFRAYCQIYNDWFRDPNLDDELEFNFDLTGDQSAETDVTTVLRNRGWDRDYFTAALPFAQRGAAVLMPLAGTGALEWSDNFIDATWETFAGGIPAAGATSISITQNLTDSGGAGIHPSASAATVTIDGATTTINDFRRALAIQSWMENNARGGGRYTEQILAHYNQRVPDYRLQRSEYLGGGRQPVTISEVRATAQDPADNIPVGYLGGHGISVGKSNRFSYHCQEHGYVIGIMSVTPTTAYDQGLERMWFRENKFDFAFPELANLGEQEILTKEVYFNFDTGSNNDDLFGYIPRYAEYKFKQDRVAGDFRDNLAFWHLGRIFSQTPVLDSVFVTMQDDPGPREEAFTRIFALNEGEDYLWVQLFHNLTAMRPLPYFGVPQLNG